MGFDTLIDAETLFAHRHDSGWVIIDCRFDLANPEAGREAYRESHIPEARYVHLDQDLSGPVTPATGRHPLPDPKLFAATLGRLGIEANSQVVAYDAASGSIAARLWWLLRWVGHRRCAVLDGGLAAWREHGFPSCAHVPAPQSLTYPLSGQDDRAWVDTRSVLAGLAGGQDLLLDARSGPRYRGEMEPIDAVAGHVPGAVSVPLEGNLDGRGRFLKAQALRRRFQAVLGDRRAVQVVHMCGSGVTACHNLLAMEVAGLRGSRLYAGSWSEWIRDVDRPVAKGEG